MLTPVSGHLGLYHKFNATLVSFIVLEAKPRNPRGGDWDKRILQKEKVWIEHCEVTRLPGINDAIISPISVRVFGWLPLFLTY